MGFWTVLLIIIYILNLITIIALIFFEKKNVSNTIAWILAITFIPILGFLLYLFLGNTAKIKILSRKYSLKNIEKEYNNILEETKAKIVNKHENNFYKDVILFNVNNNSVYTENNKVDIFIDANDKYKKMFEDIENAKSSINIEYFIIKSKDKSGKELIKLLAKKAKQGIKVRVIYDRMGCFKTRYKDFKEIIKNGGQVQRYLPSMINTLLEANYRFHRKIVVIDNEIAYTGGMNIGDDYLGKDKRITPWRDTSVKIIGDSVNMLQLRFLYDWYFLLRQNKKIDKNFDASEIMKIKEADFKNNFGIQILSSGPDSDTKYIRDAYIKIVSNAEKYVYIETPYLVPDEILSNTIRIAKLSGVDIKIIIPGIPDKKFVYNLTLAYAEELIKQGIEVYLYNGFIHSKSFVSDDYITSIGTCNVDVRSFMINYENNAIMYDKEFAIKNKEIFNKDILSSKKLLLEDLKKKGILYRIKKAIFRFIAPLV